MSRIFFSMFIKSIFVLKTNEIGITLGIFRLAGGFVFLDGSDFYPRP
jgi:hypothetical protein